jgi:multiple sugar transport system permease protein
VATATRARIESAVKRSRPGAFPYLLMLPSMIALAIFILYPIAKVIVTSLQYNVLNRPERGTPFIGLANYADAITRPQFLHSLGLAVIYTVITAGGSMLIGLLTSLALRERLRGRSFYRAAMILPWVVPPVVASLIWVWMLDRQFGVVNYLLQAVLGLKAIGWLVDTDWAMPSILLVGTWKEYPVATLMLLAGLQNIPPEYYEAASIDGASAWQRFWHITVPGLAPVSGILGLLLIIWSFRSFTYIFVMTGGGPAEATETIIINVYRQAFQYYNFGVASALGVIVLVILLVFSLVYLRLTHAGEGA